jgi:hypothetical protein
LIERTKVVAEGSNERRLGTISVSPRIAAIHEILFPDDVSQAVKEGESIIMIACIENRGDHQLLRRDPCSHAMRGATCTQSAS